MGNVVKANLLACEAEDIAGETLNIGGGTQTSLNQLIKELQAIVNTDLKVEYTDPRPGDVKHSLASVEKAQKLMGYESAIPFDEGLRRTVGWFTATK